MTRICGASGSANVDPSVDAPKAESSSAFADAPLHARLFDTRPLELYPDSNFAVHRLGAQARARRVLG